MARPQGYSHTFGLDARISVTASLTDIHIAPSTAPAANLSEALPLDFNLDP